MLFSDPFTLFSNQLHRPAAFLPTADVAVSDDDLVLTLDVPGLATDDLSLEVQDNYLIVRGERKRPQTVEGASWVHMERAFGAFERRILVPRGVDADRITASLDNGVLTLIVPKPEQLKPKTIAIGTGTEQKQLASA